MAKINCLRLAGLVGVVSIFALLRSRAISNEQANRDPIEVYEKLRGDGCNHYCVISDSDKLNKQIEYK